MDRIDILGIPLDGCSRADIHRWLDGHLRNHAATCAHLVTLNPEYVMEAQRDPAFAAAIRAADLVTADGVGVVLAARLLTGRRVDRVTGVELTERLAAISGPLRAPIYFLGAGAGVAAAAQAKLRERFPEASFAGAWDGGTPAPADDERTIERIGASEARVVLIAYGAPAQIHWIARNQAALANVGVRLAIGVGGTFDFLSGYVKRAPGPVRKVGLEWLYRLAREPWRWQRQLALPRFALAVIGQRLGKVRPGN